MEFVNLCRKANFRPRKFEKLIEQSAIRCIGEDDQCIQMLPHPVSEAAIGLGPYEWLQTIYRHRHTNP